MEIIKRNIFAGLLLLSACVLVYGLLSLDFPLILPWTKSGLANFGIYLAIYLLISIPVSFYWPNRLLPVFAISVLFLSILTIGAVAVGAVVFILLSAFCIGAPIIGKSKSDSVDQLVGAVLSINVGLAFMAVLMGPLMYLHIHYAVVYVLTLIIPIYLFRSHIRLRSLAIWINKLNTDLSSDKRSVLLLVIFGLFFFLYLIGTILNERGHDALTMHLVIVTFVKENHFWHYNPATHIWALMPMNTNWIYVLSGVLGGEAASRLMNLAIFLIIISAIYSYSKILVDRWHGWLAVLLFISLPLAFLETANTFVENFWASLLFASTISLAIFNINQKARFFYMSAFFCGVGLGAKLGATAFIPMLFIFATVSLYKTTLNVKPLHLLGYLGLILFTGMWPYLNAYLVSGNPVFPFLNAVFQSPYYETAANFENTLFQNGISWDILYRITFYSSEYLEANSGAVGFSLFLLLPLTVVITLVDNRNFNTLLLFFLSMGFLIITFINEAYLRYAYPAIPLLLVLIATGLKRVKTLPGVWFYRSTLGMLGMTLLLNLIFLPAAGHTHKDLSILEIPDKESMQEAYWERRPIRKAIDFLNFAYEEKKVALLSGPYAADLKGEALVYSWHNYEFVYELNSTSSLNELKRIMEKHDFTHAIIAKNEIRPHIKKLNTWIRMISETEFSFGGLEVMKFQKDNFFFEEMLTNIDFEGGTEGWYKISNPEYNAESNSVFVTKDNRFGQIVSVEPETKYLMVVRARCIGSQTTFRLQLNWQDQDGEFLMGDWVTAECPVEYADSQNIFVAPTGAYFAVIFATGDTTDIVEIDKVSLLK